MTDAMRLCRECVTELPVERFERSRNTCKLCRSRRRDASMSPEERLRKRQYHKEWAANHSADLRQYHAGWRAENKEKVSAYSAATYQKSKDQVAANTAKWRADNKERVAAKNAQWYRRNPLKAKEARQRRRALLAQAPTVSFTTAELHARLAYFGFRCWMCRKPFEHLDHVKPLAKGGSHMLANLRPACAACNHRKRAHWLGSARVNDFKAVGL
jgi:5-methylcytosine-specific restriction endonuclease McrA